MSHPFIMNCCGRQKFVALPFLGYTRMEETLILLAVMWLLFLIPFGVLKLASTPKEKLTIGTFFTLVIAVVFQVVYNSDYVTFALSSIDASVADTGSLRTGYEFYRNSLPDSESRGQLDVFTREWRRKPHVSVGVLTPEEANDLAESILSERERFYHVDHLAFPLPFFTHGPYWGYHTFDGTANKDVSKARPSDARKLSTTYTTYVDALNRDRDFMMDKYSMLYERVRTALSEALGGGEIKHLEGVGLPGFHIIPSHIAWSLQVFRFHTDEAYEMFLNSAEEGKRANFDHKANNCDPTSRISFTLPIRMPDETSGLNYIDFGEGTGESLDGGLKAQRYYEETCSKRYPYRCYIQRREMYEVGNLVVHAGKLVHSIGHWNYTSYDTERITMQGFGFRCRGPKNDKDTWFIYW
ncbi:hypothetical protein TrVE_jg12254 [Triparma verrucosa]|uniref:Uncharacterized protein n=1 Tax=Triparma verrucosa TaxID=1606542 RepID=A0A9W7CG84_9STRA|nr:hypothetical protein TrVE_jg12254 [Triparma verrucosa]